jgi:hypothetical protein
MTEDFTTNVDIGARACQFCGDFRLFSFEDPSPQAREISFAYDKLRLAELQRIVWRFATRRAVLRPIDMTTMLFVPAAWSASVVYGFGDIVNYSGLLYVSQDWPTPGIPPDVTPVWAPYFGPMTISSWEDPTGTSTTSPNAGYYAGELVYTPATENYVIYVSLANSNTDTPGDFPDWAASTIYKRGDTLMYPTQRVFSEPGDIPVFSEPGDIPVYSAATGPWQSQKDLNLGIIPGSDPTSWVLISDTGQTDYQTGTKWLRLDSTLRGLGIVYPLGVGPVTDTQTRNIYRLPNGYLRHAPDQVNPNEIMRVMGVVSAAPSDAQFENGYMVTSEVKTVMIRFVADMTDVTQMDNLFCEGLAARIALDVGPVILPKEERTSTLMRVARRYKDVIADARAVDAVERGASAQPQSQYVSVRF